MHKCEQCGAEFEGKFCPECGAEWLDGTARCPKCGAPVNQDAKFCTSCGARLDGKVVCPNCGKEFDGEAAFCDACGAKLTSHGKTVKKAININVKSVLSLSGTVCLLLSVLFGLVFTFVCGVTLTSGEGSETQMLYEYFGNAYKDIDTVKDAIKQQFNFAFIGESREFALYFPIVLGTIISALGILGAVGLSGFTAWQTYRKFYKKQEVSIVAPAVATFLCYATMATLLLALVSSTAADMSVKFSSPTLAGLIVGGVFLGLGLLLSAGSHYEAFKGFDAAAGAIFAVVISALTVVVLAVTALPAGGANIMYWDGYRLVTAKTSYSLFTGMQAMLYTTGADATINKAAAYGGIGGVAVIALAVIAAVSLFRKLPALCNGKNKSNIVLYSVLAALAVVYLTFSVLFVNLMFEDSQAKIDKDFTAPIVILVMAVVALVCEIASKFVLKLSKKEI